MYLTCNPTMGLHYTYTSYSAQEGAKPNLDSGPYNSVTVLIHSFAGYSCIYMLVKWFTHHPGERILPWRDLVCVYVSMCMFTVCR